MQPPIGGVKFLPDTQIATLGQRLQARPPSAPERPGHNGFPANAVLMSKLKCPSPVWRPNLLSVGLSQHVKGHTLFHALVCGGPAPTATRLVCMLHARPRTAASGCPISGVAAGFEAAPDPARRRPFSPHAANLPALQIAPPTVRNGQEMLSNEGNGNPNDRRSGNRHPDTESVSRMSIVRNNHRRAARATGQKQYSIKMAAACIQPPRKRMRAIATIPRDWAA